MSDRLYEIVIEPDRFEDGTPAFMATCPALQGCITWGSTVEEAIRNAREVVELLVLDMQECGELPPENAREEKMELKLPASVYISI